MYARLAVCLVVLWLTGCVSQEVRAPTGPQNDFAHINDMDEVPAVLSQLRGRVLLVLDIDDTLLTTPYLTPSAPDEKHRKFFGSDRWYVWQSNKTTPPAPSDKVPCLFDVLEWNAQVATQAPTEDDAAEDINALKVDKLILTSRNPTTRAATERELKHAGYTAVPNLKPSKVPAVELYQGKNGWMTYANGVMMTNGSGKGDALVQLFRRHGLTKRYATVVLLDDTVKNLNSVKEELEKELPKMRFEGRNYARIKELSGPVRTGDEADAEVPQARKDWVAWLAMMDGVYPERMARIRANKCEN